MMDGPEPLRPRPLWWIGLVAAGAAVWVLPSYPFVFGCFCGILVPLYAASRRPQVPEKIASCLLTPTDDPQHAGSVSRRFWPAFGSIVVGGAFFFLEIRQPFYFTQDDNLVQFLPSILQGCRSLFGGVFPTWNPYQFMGGPSTSLGIYALTYPPTYFSYWIARTIFSNEYLTIEIFVILHLMVGYGLIYWATRREGVRPSLSVLTAVCCVLSGYALIAGRSWYYVAPVFIWLPLMIICVQGIRRDGAGWKSVLGLAASIGVFAHAGNVQMWLYCLLLLGVAVLVLLWTGALPTRSLLPLGTALCFGIALAAPLLIPQFLATRNIMRVPYSIGIGNSWPTLFVPVSVSHTSGPGGGWWGVPNQHLLGEIYYSGTLFCAVGAALLLSLILFRWGRTRVECNVWFICALAALLFALGESGGLWIALSQLPGFSGFRLPFKFTELFDIFMVISGAAALERCLRQSRNHLRWELALSATVVALVAYHCTLCSASFYSYGFRPYPAVDASIATRLQPDENGDSPKYLTVGTDRSTAADYARSLNGQLGVLPGFFNADGYDALLSAHPLHYKTHWVLHQLDGNISEPLREYGVKYLVAYESRIPPVTSVPASLVYRSGNVSLWELPAPRPMAFAESRPAQPLPVRFDGAGADLDTSAVKNGGRVILNMLWHEEVSAFAGRTEVTTDGDAWGRIRVTVPSGVEHVRIRFRPPWAKGVLASIVALTCGLGLATLAALTRL